MSRTKTEVATHRDGTETTYLLAQAAGASTELAPIQMAGTKTLLAVVRVSKAGTR